MGTGKKQAMDKKPVHSAEKILRFPAPPPPPQWTSLRLKTQLRGCCRHRGAELRVVLVFGLTTSVSAVHQVVVGVVVVGVVVVVVGVVVVVVVVVLVVVGVGAVVILVI